MNVGVCKLTLRLPENQSLKGKRRVLNSLCTRIRNQFNVSISEVAENQALQLATLGIVCVTNSIRHANVTLDKVIAFIEGSRKDVELIECERETSSGF